jgi:hypothetical protein
MGISVVLNQSFQADASHPLIRVPSGPPASRGGMLQLTADGSPMRAGISAGEGNSKRPPSVRTYRASKSAPRPQRAQLAAASFGSGSV